jgi:hypothetical protein
MYKKGVFMQIRIPRLNNITRGYLFLISGIILFLHVTNLVPIGLNIIVLLASLGLIFYGLLELDAFSKLATCLKKK